MHSWNKDGAAECSRCRVMRFYDVRFADDREVGHLECRFVYFFRNGETARKEPPCLG